MTIPSGTRLGPYEVLDPLGAGGMGEVYKARDTRLDRSVAIKVLPPHLSGSADFKLRFEREARTISGLNHPNICTLHDIGKEGDLDFLVMEYLEGETLADRLTKGPLPVQQVVRYGIEIAAALDRAHRSGIVHRDLKPGNIMLTKSGAKLLDFGLAKPSAFAVGGASGASMYNEQTQQKPLTAEGQIVGTFQYMAPEQLEGAEADARTDIFAFGAILYEMATGNRAFDGKTKASLIASILDREPPPISEVQPLTPPLLERVVKTALQKDPDDRWQTAHDLLLELKWIEEGGSQAGVAAPVIARRKNRERLAWTLAGAVTLLAIVAAYGWYAALRKPREMLRASIVPQAGVTPFMEQAFSGGLTVSPDGQLVTFSAPSGSGPPMLWIRPVAEAEARPLKGTEGAIFPFWSPDSRNLAFFADGKLKKISVTGGPAITICDTEVNPRSGSWNRDDVIIFSVSSVTGIFRVPASGGKPVPVTTLDSARGESTHRWATFLPDHNHFLYMVGSHSATQAGEENAIYVGALDGKTRKHILYARSNPAYASGYLLYIRDGILVAHEFNSDKLELKGEPQPVAPEIYYQTAFFHGTFSVSNQGTLVYRSRTTNDKVTASLLDRAGKEITRIAEDRWFEAVLSPDEKRFVATVEDQNLGTADLWLYDLQRNARSRITFQPSNEFRAVWSPDGTRIVYAADALKSNEEDLVVKAIAGGSGEETLLENGGLNEPTSWSPDGRYIAYAARTARNQKSDLWIVPLFGDRKPFPFLQGPFEETDLQFSPDGRLVAYISDESGRPEVYVTTFPGAAGKWQISSEGGFASRWTKGGKELWYAGPGIHQVSIAMEGNEVVAGTPQLLFNDPALIHLSVSPDGERILALKTNPDSQQGPIKIVTNWDAPLKK